jgi:pimeloyl-ACP methyl ester carboxylesterase
MFQALPALSSLSSRTRSAAATIVLACLLAGCAGVKVSSTPTRDYMAQRRGDILTTGQLSAAATTTLQVVGSDRAACVATPPKCRDLIGATSGLSDEQRQSALAELWLDEGLALERKQGAVPDHEAVVNAYLEAARHAYAYLFVTSRSPEQRALEERQGQVRDYYNFAVQQAVTHLFQAARQAGPSAQQVRSDGTFSLVSGTWRISGSMEDGLARPTGLPISLGPAASLTFAGLRSQYRRDGIGASLVAEHATPPLAQGQAAHPFRETPFSSATVVFSFGGTSLEEILATRDAGMTAYDPYHRRTVTLAGSTVPLAGDFTAAYGLWLARSDFGTQSLLTLVGRGDTLDKPRLYLMQPYDPKRRTIIMLHGLASSPEAWINVANELLGDQRLRQQYQIWQIYYPTNIPVAINNVEIRNLINRTVKHFDPGGKANASQDMVLIGHSMGGLLGRLAVSSSRQRLWDDIVRANRLEGRRLERARTVIAPFTVFEPLPEVTRAVFVAAPHRGTPFAESRLARMVARLVALPAAVLGQVKEVAELLKPGANNLNSPLDTANGVRNLSDQDPFIQAAAELPIGQRVRFHSIIGNDTPLLALANSGDGVVPYNSAHLAGAQSELVISSAHSVQETPAAILEIRRILHLHLDDMP